MAGPLGLSNAIPNAFPHLPRSVGQRRVSNGCHFSAPVLCACRYSGTLPPALGAGNCLPRFEIYAGVVNLHGRSDAFAEQELYADLTAFNFASRVCREVVVRQPSDGIYAYKVNFKMAVMLCKEFLRTPNADSEKLLEEIARHTVPIRPNRQDERNLKVKGFAGFVYRVAA